MHIVIGLTIAAGALFLAWMFLHHGGPLGTTANPTSQQGIGGAIVGGASKLVGGTLGLLNTTLGMGVGTARLGISAGEAVAKGAIGLTSDAVDATTSTLKSAAVLGGKVVSNAGSVTSTIASLNYQVYKAGIGIPAAAAAPIGKDVAKGATIVAKTVANGATTAAQAVGSAGEKVGSTIKSGISAIGNIF